MIRVLCLRIESYLKSIGTLPLVYPTCGNPLLLEVLSVVSVMMTFEYVSRFSAFRIKRLIAYYLLIERELSKVS
jgi:hypothetical protein